MKETPYSNEFLEPSIESKNLLEKLEEKERQKKLAENEPLARLIHLCGLSPVQLMRSVS